jgi:hypothetical protein
MRKVIIEIKLPHHVAIDITRNILDLLDNTTTPGQRQGIHLRTEELTHMEFVTCECGNTLVDNGEDVENCNQCKK